MSNFFRNFLQNFSITARPMYGPLTKDGEFSQGNECKGAYKRVKKLLAEATDLHHPDWDLPFVVRTDASRVGCGAALSNKTPEGSLQPLGFFSKTSDKAQYNYAVS